jgi:hypothetical protein
VMIGHQEEKEAMPEVSRCSGNRSAVGQTAFQVWQIGTDIL